MTPLLAALLLFTAQKATQDELARKSPEELAALAKARADNPNKPAPWWDAAKIKPDSWYASAEARRMADNILTWQDHGGGWPLMNTTREPFTGDASKAGPWGAGAALIKATTNEVRFLSRMYAATGDERYRTAAIGGVRFVLQTQYPTGGWPHSWPVRMDDYTHYATFNDDMMPDLMGLLREVSGEPRYAFMGRTLRNQCKAAFGKGVDFILKSQIKVDGKLTAWGQQHDEKTYQVRPARNFEPAAISGGESASVLLLLMTIDKPSPQVKRAIEAGVDWYHRSQINGLRVTVADGDRVATPDAKAPPVWARFYEIPTGRPIFAGRDSVIRYSLAEVEKERRGGYGWYNQNGTQVFRAYEAWKARVGR